MHPRPWIVAALLAISIATVYGWAVGVPFIYDDKSSIAMNESIKSLWPLIGTTGHPAPLTPPIDTPVSGRPLVNLSFAINYYFDGFKTTGYHPVAPRFQAMSALPLRHVTEL